METTAAAERDILIRNIGLFLTGDLACPIRNADSMFISRGKIVEIGSGLTHDADVVIDANGLSVMPGLVDSHTHPVFGEFAPPQSSATWLSCYLHGGVTTVVSAGELHLPGLPLPPDPETAMRLALLARTAFGGSPHPWGVRVYAGTLLLVPGLREADFDVLARHGCRLVKFIFYDFDGAPPGEAEAYVRWAHERGMVVKLHSGGVSRSGVSRRAGLDVIRKVKPDVVAHINGGPIPMPFDEIRAVVRETAAFLEVASSGSVRAMMELMDEVHAQKAYERVCVGTDTPGGTGIIPRGMLHNVMNLASVCEVDPAVAICMATGNSARAHRLEVGILREGLPADCLLLDRIEGSSGKDMLEALRLGNLPGISVVIVDGQVRVAPRSQQTPPPVRLARISSRHGRSLDLS